MSDQLDPCGLTYDECASLAKTYEVRNQAVISLIVANADRLRAAKGGKLHDQRIEELAREHDNESRNCFAFNHDGYRSIYTFARAIEREVRAAPSAAAPQQAVPDLHNAIMNLPCKRTMSHFASTSDLKLYKEGHREARHAAAELVAESAAAPVAAIEQPGADQPLTGKLLDEISQLPVLWGLNEPGALLRNSDVFRVLANASKSLSAQAAPDTVRNQALEEAAKLCKVIGKDWEDNDETNKSFAADYVADSILALRTQPPAGSQHKGKP